MMTVFIGVCALVVIIACVNNGEWGAAGITVVITLILIAMAADDRKDTKAWLNCRDYWANGGPAQYRDERGGQRQRLFATQSAVTYGKPQRQPEMQHVLHTCARCGGKIHEVCRTVYNGGATFVTYGCPGCGEQKMVKMQ